MKPTVNIALLAVLGVQIIKRGRRHWYSVNLDKEGQPAFETGPFKTRQDAIHYANALAGGPLS